MARQRGTMIAENSVMASNFAWWLHGRAPVITAASFLRAILVFASVFLLTPLAHAAENQARDFRLVGDATRARIVVDFDQEPSFLWMLLRAPHRLVIDLPGARFAFDPADTRGKGLVRSVRYGSLDGEASRLVIGLDGPFAVEKIEVVRQEDAHGYRLTAELTAATEAEFSQALGDQSQTTASVKPAPLAPAPAAKRFKVVIDPGHGGVDGGAEGLNGTIEKEITLAFSQELKAALSGFEALDVVMTRDGDKFLRLDERVAIAQREGASLLISIHADTIRVPGIHGATVYTVSDKASDPEAEALAIRENLSDALSGITVEEDNQQVADILVDLIRRETHGLSMRFARSLVTEMTGQVGLIKNPHRSAGFKVLKAPDVPSVLVELGYLSNDKDEERLRDPAWRATAIAAITTAVSEFAGVKTAATAKAD